jgi:hypothetical protein
MFRLAASLLKLELRSAFERRQVGGIQLESVLEGTQRRGRFAFSGVCHSSQRPQTLVIGSALQCGVCPAKRLIEIVALKSADYAG